MSFTSIGSTAYLYSQFQFVRFILKNNDLKYLKWIYLHKDYTYIHHEMRTWMVIYQILMTSNFLQRSPRWMKYLHMEVMTPCVVGRFRDGWGPLAKSSLVWYDDQWSNQQFFAKIVLNIEDVLYLMEIFLCPDIQKSIVLIPETNNKKGYLLLHSYPYWNNLVSEQGVTKRYIKENFLFQITSSSSRSTSSIFGILSLT